MGERIRLIVKPPGAYKPFLALAAGKDWQLASTTEKHPNHPLRFQQVFTPSDRSVTIHYVEDDLAGVPYIQVTGAGREGAAAEIAATVPVYTQDELLASWDEARDVDEKADAILALGVAAPVEPSEPFVRRLREALTDQSAEVRSAGLVATSYECWPELEPLVEKIRDTDASADAKERARIMLEGWDEVRAHSRAE